MAFTSRGRNSQAKPTLDKRCNNQAIHLETSRPCAEDLGIRSESPFFHKPVREQFGRARHARLAGNEAVHQHPQRKKAKNLIGVAGGGTVAGIVATAGQTAKIRRGSRRVPSSLQRSPSKLEVAKQVQLAIDNVPKDAINNAFGHALKARAFKETCTNVALMQATVTPGTERCDKTFQAFIGNGGFDGGKAGFNGGKGGFDGGKGGPPHFSAPGGCSVPPGGHASGIFDRCRPHTIDTNTEGQRSCSPLTPAFGQAAGGWGAFAASSSGDPELGEVSSPKRKRHAMDMATDEEILIQAKKRCLEFPWTFASHLSTRVKELSAWNADLQQDSLRERRNAENIRAEATNAMATQEALMRKKDAEWEVRLAQEHDKVRKLENDLLKVTQGGGSPGTRKLQNFDV